MSESRKNSEPLNIPEATQEEAKGIIRQAFGLFANHFKSLADSLAEFNKKRQEARERIERGASRNDGRIV